MSDPERTFRTRLQIRRLNPATVRPPEDDAVALVANVAGDILVMEPDGSTSALGSGPGGAVDSVNGQTGVVVLDAGDLDTAVGPGPTVEDTLAALGDLSHPALTDVLNNGSSAGSGGIQDLADPSSPQDAATKAYVDLTAPTTDQKAALDAANAPDGSNPFATVADAPAFAAILTASGDAGANPITNLQDVSGSGDGDATLKLSDAAVQIGYFGTIELSMGPLVGFALSAGAAGVLGTANEDLFLSVGSGRNLVISGLPTANPVSAGALWVDTTGGFNILKVSAG